MTLFFFLGSRLYLLSVSISLYTYRDPNVFQVLKQIVYSFNLKRVYYEFFYPAKIQNSIRL